MDNNKYLSKLEKYLKELPPEDRADAISYYAEYLAEVGPNGAKQAEATLGSPAQVAAGIMADYAMRNMGKGRPKVKRGLSAVWFAIIGVFALPVGLPIAVALFCIVFALFIVLFTVIISLYASAIGVFASGLAFTIIGFVILPQGVPTGLFYIGGGMAAIGVGILLFIAVTALMRVSLKGVAKLFNAIRHRKINKQIRENAKTQQEYGTGMPQTDAPNVTQQTVAPNITRQTGKSAQASDSGITRQEYGTGVPQTDAPNITQQTDAPDITQQSDAPDITQQSDAPDITQQTGEHASAADITPEAYAPVTEGGEAK